MEASTTIAVTWVVRVNESATRPATPAISNARVSVTQSGGKTPGSSPRAPPAISSPVGLDVVPGPAAPFVATSHILSRDPPARSSCAPGRPRPRYRPAGANERLELFGDDREFPHSAAAEPAGPQFMRGHQLIESTPADLVGDPRRVPPVRVHERRRRHPMEFSAL